MTKQKADIPASRLVVGLGGRWNEIQNTLQWVRNLWFIQLLASTVLASHNVGRKYVAVVKLKSGSLGRSLN